MQLLASSGAVLDLEPGTRTSGENEKSLACAAPRTTMRRRRPDAIAFSICLMLVASGFHPLVMHSLAIPDLWIQRWLYVLQFAASAVLLALIAQLGRRLAKALAEARSTNARLEAKVREVTRQMESSYARRMRLERERAAAAVRERIYQDLHDDVGAKLLSLVYASTDPHQTAIAREALREIRFIVSPERLEGGSACDVAADWRIEVETRCEQARYRLEWRQRLDDAVLTGIERYHLDRILRELVSNALEHSGGTALRLIATSGGGRIRLIVEDDGRGFAVDETPAGQGLAGIRRRVESLGGEVRWDCSRRCGTRCVIHIPLSQGAGAECPAP